MIDNGSRSEVSCPRPRASVRAPLPFTQVVPDRPMTFVDHIHSRRHTQIVGKPTAADHPAAPNRLSRKEWPWLLLLVGIHLGLAGFLTFWTAPTIDETAHLPAGLAIWKFGKTDLYRVNPPLVRAIASFPVHFLPHQEDWSHYVPGSPGRCEWRVGADFVAANGLSAPWLYTVARWWCLPFSVIGLLVCWFWGKELTNSIGGGIAATLWCFSPNLLGHGALITNDVAATSFGLLAAWRFQHWLKASHWQNAGLAGLTLGFALLAKTYWWLFLVIWPLLVCYRRIRAIQTDDPASPTGKMLAQLAMIMLLGLQLLNLGYGFRGTGTVLGDVPFYSRFLSGEHRNLELDVPGNRFRGSWLGRIPLPFPLDYVTGIDLQKHDLERPHINYLWGEVRQGGWWSYYLIGLGVKVPLGTWLLILLVLRSGCDWKALIRNRLPWPNSMIPSAAKTIVDRTGSRIRIQIGELLPLGLPCLALFLIASFETGMNRHFRYVFPVLPLGFLIAAHAALLDQFGLSCARVEIDKNALKPVRKGQFVLRSAFLRSELRRSVSMNPEDLPASASLSEHESLTLASPSSFPDRLLQRNWLWRSFLFTAVCASLMCYPHHLAYFNLAGKFLSRDRPVLIDSNLDWGQDLLHAKAWIDAHPQCRPVTLAAVSGFPVQALGIHCPFTPVGEPKPGWHLISIHLLNATEKSYSSFRNLQPVGCVGRTFHIYYVPDHSNSSSSRRSRFVPLLPESSPSCLNCRISTNPEPLAWFKWVGKK